MLASRQTYQSSGRVSWRKLTLGFVLSSPFALLAGTVLCVAFWGGFYLLFFIPLVAGLLASATAWITVAAGKCRNRWVGAAVGLAAGLVALVGYLQLDLAHEEGPGVLYRLDLLPGHVLHRVETDQLGRIRRMLPVPGQPAAPGGRPAWPDFAWGTFVFDALCVALVPVLLGWARASRPFSEEEGRWLHEHLFYVEAEDARAMADALEAEDAEGLAEAAQTISLRPLSKIGDGRLYYLPYKQDTPVYLTLRIVDGRPWSIGWRRSLATRVRLSADEATALAERLRLPGASFGVLEVEPVLDAPRRAAPAAVIEDLPPAEAGKVLNRRVFAALTVIALGPLALGVVVALGLGVYVGVHWSDLGGLARAGAAAVALAGLVAALRFTMHYGDYLPARIQQRLCAAAIRRRPGALVRPDDPDAVYVSVVPRKNWGRLMLEECTDIGLLKIDPARRELLFEGDRQRWRIPTDSIHSCELEEYSIGQPTPSEINVHPVAVLRVNRDGVLWEAPLCPARTTVHRPSAEAKRSRCRQLRQRVRTELLGRPAEGPPDR
jgi:hypothetical protein